MKLSSHIIAIPVSFLPSFHFIIPFDWGVAGVSGSYFSGEPDVCVCTVYVYACVCVPVSVTGRFTCSNDEGSG